MPFNRLIPPLDDFYPFKVNNSGRFSGTDDNLSRTFTNSSRQRSVFSTWVKRARNTADTPLAQGEVLLCGFIDSNSYTDIFFDKTSDQIRIYGQTASSGHASINTDAAFRDDSNFMHVVVSIDTTEAVATDRVKFYVNGVERSATHVTPLGSGDVVHIGDDCEHFVGSLSLYSAEFCGYLAETVYLQGLSIQNGDVAIGDFGQFVKMTWTPKKIDFNVWSGYGSDSFYFEYQDDADMGVNSRSGGSNWTENGAVYRSGDTPTNNLAMLTILEPTCGAEFLGANVTMRAPSTGWVSARANIPFPTSGKWYVQGYAGAMGATANGLALGIAEGTDCASWFWNTSARKSIAYKVDGTIREENGGVVGTDNYSTWEAIGDRVAVCLDMDAEEVTFTYNGVEQLTHDLSDWNLSEVYFYCSSYEIDSRFIAQFGADNFKPPGYKRLTSMNLPEPEVTDRRKGFWIKHYDGTGVAQDITGADFDVSQSGMVWLKSRYNTAASRDHKIADHVTTPPDVLTPNLDSSMGVGTALTALLNNGFTLGTALSSNESGGRYASWVWNMSARYGGEVITWSGTGVNRPIPHNLGRTPTLIIIKRTDAAADWVVYSKSPGPNYYLTLNDMISSTNDVNIFQGSGPTSSNFYIGTDAKVNADGGFYVAYVFANVPGFSNVGGQYVGNGSVDGPVVNCGFRPAFLIVKSRWAENRNWLLWDKVATPYNARGLFVMPNHDNNESLAEAVDFVSHGFKIRHTGADLNNSGTPYLFIAFADQPFKYSNAF